MYKYFSLLGVLLSFITSGHTAAAGHPHANEDEICKRAITAVVSAEPLYIEYLSPLTKTDLTEWQKHYALPKALDSYFKQLHVQQLAYVKLLKAGNAPNVAQSSDPNIFQTRINGNLFPSSSFEGFRSEYEGLLKACSLSPLPQAVKDTLGITADTSSDPTIKALIALYWVHVHAERACHEADIYLESLKGPQ